MNQPAIIISNNIITLNFDGETHALYLDAPGTEAVMQALKEKRWADIPDLVSKAKAIKKYTEGLFTIDGSVLKIDGREIPVSLATKILEFKDQGLPYEGLVNFARNLLKNQSFRAIHQLFTFLDRNSHPITEDGCFIAYKWVNSDFFDTYTGKTFLNVPGAEIEMPRNEVNEDPNQTCSTGIHVANWDYAINHYGRGRDGKMIEVRVNPADVVAVPVDYNNSKMRVCKYVVIGEVKSERTSLLVRQDNTDYSAPESCCEADYSNNEFGAVLPKGIADVANTRKSLYPEHYEDINDGPESEEDLEEDLEEDEDAYCDTCGAYYNRFGGRHMPGCTGV